MQKGTAERWIYALSSGKYKFGAGQLRYDDHFCPLGILLDTINPNAWVLAWDETSYTWEGEQFFLPERIMRGSKIKTRELRFVTENGEHSSLVELNDFYGSSKFEWVVHAIKNYYQQM